MSEMVLYGIPDGERENWPSEGLLWADAPKPEEAIPLVTFYRTRGVQRGLYELSSPELLDFLKSDVSGVVSFLIDCKTPGRKKQEARRSSRRGFMKTQTLFLLAFVLLGSAAIAKKTKNRQNWRSHVGKAGPSGWRVHVIQPDPEDHGPDGINFHDWDGDGAPDLFVNYEEGAYSRLYFNPGKAGIRELWTDFITFKHGKCEDSGIGDLDNDGDIDYVANGGWVYFNPGKKAIRDTKRWVKMILFDKEERVPTVTDIDGDGLNDLIVGGRAWYKQPISGKHDAANWKRYELGETRWVMTCIVNDIDNDGDNDILIHERRKQGVFYYQNSGDSNVTKPWPVKMIDDEAGYRFMTLGDVNGDGRLDLVRAGKKIDVLLRTNDKGAPNYKKIQVAQPTQRKIPKVEAKPKGVALMELNNDLTHPEILILPKCGQLWYLTLSGDGTSNKDWTSALMDMPGPETRLKNDNVYLSDLDGDGDIDFATTEENGGWGVVWFENPQKKLKNERVTEQ